MSNDKAFAAWVMLVIGGAGLLLLCLDGLLFAGVASFPPVVTIAEHAAMGLCVRAAYKWVGGFEWADWSIAGDAGEPTAAGELEAQRGSAAPAMG